MATEDETYSITLGNSEAEIALVESLAKIVTDYKLTSLELGEIKITKQKHDTPQPIQPLASYPQGMTASEIEALMGYSSGV